MSTDAELHLLKAQWWISKKERRLRDEFAIAAMQAFLPDFWFDGTFARKAYEAADEMMKEREK